MEFGRESSQSLWQNVEFPMLSGLNSHQTADVCIIGAGIAGLTSAYQLLKEGKSVVVLERDGLGLGPTGLTAAHLSTQLDYGYARALRTHGPGRLRLMVESHEHAIDTIERISATEGIACGFERVAGYLFLGPGDCESTLREEEAAALEAGMAVEALDFAPIQAFHTGPCLRFARQAQLHPLLYLAGLARAVGALGGKIFIHTEAQAVEGRRPARVTTARGFQVVCGSIVVAAGAPFLDRLKLNLKLAPYRSYMVALRVKKHEAEKALLWDTAKPYHYLRWAADATGPLLLVGGGDHRTGQETKESHYEALLQWASLRLGAEGTEVGRWSGQILEPYDGIGFAGRNPGGDENIYVTTGGSGQGLTHGTLSGTLLTDLILKRENPWATAYDPSRRPSLRTLGSMLAETAQSTLPYSDWLTGGDGEILPGEGGVVRDGISKVAVYKDPSGRSHFYSATCPHLGGIVRWNTEEKTWDCPCHGSRFDRHGKVLNGPAPSGLREIAAGLAAQEDRASA